MYNPEFMKISVTKKDFKIFKILKKIIYTYIEIEIKRK